MLLQAQTSYTRSSRYTRSSSDTSGVEYVVYDYTDVDETFEEAASAGFWGWYQQSGSWQSSWRSNRKKRKQHWQQQQQQQAQAQQQAKQQASRQQQHTRQQAARQAQQRQARQRQQAQERLRYRHQLQFTTVEKLLSQLDAASLKLVRSLFGQELERLDSSEVSQGAGLWHVLCCNCAALRPVD
jgi:DNA anti-recombination protein RmuC